MKVSSSKICNESNHTKLTFNRGGNSLTLLFTTIFDWIDKINRKRKFTYLAVPGDVQFNQQKLNRSDEVWSLVHWKYGMIKTIRNFIQLGKTSTLTSLLAMIFCWIEKQWMIVMQDECESIKNMEWVELDKHFIQSGKNILTSMSLKISIVSTKQ